MVRYVIDAVEEGKLPVREQWRREMEREVLSRNHEPCYHRPRWLDALAKGSSNPRHQITALPYSPEEVEKIRKRTQEWNQAGMEVIDVLRRWAETEAQEV